MSLKVQIGPADPSLTSARERFAHARSSPPRIGLIWLDYLMLGVFALLLVPVYMASRLPFRIDFGTLAGAYWIGTAAASVFVAVVLSVMGLPLRLTVLPCMRRLQKNKILALMVLLSAVCMVFWLGWKLGLMLIVDTLAAAELMTHKGRDFEGAVADIVVPAAYLFAVLLLLFSYNHAIAGIEYAGTYDALFTRLDAQMLHFHVSQFAHWGQGHLPDWLFETLQFIYFGLYSRVGAVLILLALLQGQDGALRYVHTVFAAYILAVAVFCLVPVKGPYLACAAPLAGHPHAAATMVTQQVLVTKAKLLWAHRLNAATAKIDLVDYFIGFPSMHAALPVIAIWRMRRWKRISVILAAIYLCLLLPATILLEWHYLADLLGGFLVAALAIRVSGHVESWLEQRAARRVPEMAAIEVQADTRRRCTLCP